MKYKYITIVLVLLLLLVAAIGLFFRLYPKTPLITYYRVTVSQDIHQYVPKALREKRLMSVQQQHRHSQEFISRFFAPWHWSDLQHIRTGMNEAEQAYWMRFSDSASTYYDRHQRPYSKAWFKQITLNAKQYEPLNQNAIVTKPAYLRGLPTMEPVYLSSHIAGQGAPFDVLQESSLWIGQPLRVIGQTRDHRWSLVVLSGEEGWIESQSIADVTLQFINTYRQAALQAMIADNVAIRDDKGRVVGLTRIGMLMPSVNHHLKLAVKNPQTNLAQWVSVTLPQKSYTSFPVSATGQHVMQLMSQLLGEPYGWGGLYYYRDCSMTVKSLYAALGIWLPRSSSEQSTIGRGISLAHLTEQQKRHRIKQYAKPLMTLLNMPGHVVIYLGEYHGKQYVFQDDWGIHTKGLRGYRGRAVIGKTVITSIMIGKDIPRATETLLQRINHMVVLI